MAKKSITYSQDGLGSPNLIVEVRCKSETILNCIIGLKLYQFTRGGGEGSVSTGVDDKSLSNLHCSILFIHDTKAIEIHHA